MWWPSVHINYSLMTNMFNISASFDEEIIKIERDKLEFEKEYKIQKIEVLSR